MPKAIPIQQKKVPGQKASRIVSIGKTAAAGRVRIAGRKSVTTDPRYRQITEVVAEVPEKPEKTKSKGKK